MGLDMYLYAEKYLSSYAFKEEDEKESFRTILKGVGFDEPICKSTPALTISMVVAYWRKANQIHDWFVENVQEGEDECQKSYVERGQLQDLLDLCKLALRDKNTEMLPTKSGFFFGSTDYNEYYWEDIKLTINQLESVLNNEKLKDWSFYYQASW